MISIFRFLRTILLSVLCISMITLPVQPDLAMAQNKIVNSPAIDKPNHQLTNLPLKDVEGVESYFRESFDNGNVDLNKPEFENFFREAAEGYYALSQSEEEQKLSTEALKEILVDTGKVHFLGLLTPETIRPWIDALKNYGNANLLTFFQEGLGYTVQEGLGYTVQEGLGYTVTESSNMIIRLGERQVRIPDGSQPTPGEIGVKLLLTATTLWAQKEGQNLSEEKLLTLIGLSGALKGLVDDLVALYLGVLTVLLFLFIGFGYSEVIGKLLLIWLMPLIVFIYVALYLSCIFNDCGSEVEVDELL